MFKLGLSKRLKLPVFYVLGTPVSPHKALKLKYDLRWLNKIEETDEDIVFEAHGNWLKLLRGAASVLVFQWQMWEKTYLPHFSLEGKTVLEVGACCGETSFFYFLHGANKIVAIEPYDKAVRRLRENAKVNGWNIEILEERFSLEHLEVTHDFMQMSINGDEKILLDADLKKPCVVKVTGFQTQREFAKKRFVEVGCQGNLKIMERC